MGMVVTVGIGLGIMMVRVIVSGVEKKRSVVAVVLFEDDRVVEDDIPDAESVEDDVGGGVAV